MSDNWTRFPNWLLDEVMPKLKPGEWQVLCAIVRQTYGYGKEEDAISISQLQALTGIAGRHNITNAIKALLKGGYIQRRKAGQGFAYRIASHESLLVTNDDQSRIVTATSHDSLPEVVTNRDTQKKKERKKRQAPESPPDPVLELERHFTNIAGILPGRGNYATEWEAPLKIILEGAGGVDAAKKRMSEAVDFARASPKRYTLASPRSITTIIANMPEANGNGKVKVGAR